MDLSDYLRRNFFGSTTHIVNNPTKAPAATIASINQRLPKTFSTYHFMHWCYRNFSKLLTLCYIFRVVEDEL